MANGAHEETNTGALSDAIPAAIETMFCSAIPTFIYLFSYFLINLSKPDAIPKSADTAKKSVLSSAKSNIACP